MSVLAVVEGEDVVGWLQFGYGDESNSRAVCLLCGVDSRYDGGKVGGEVFGSCGVDAHFGG